jgi:hypothetical protein
VRRRVRRLQLTDLLPSGVAWIFEAMRVAEEELEHAGAGNFGALLPTHTLRRKTLDLYRAHVRELLARREHLELGTAAEVVGAFSDVSQIHPLSGEAMAVLGLAAREVVEYVPELRRALQPVIDDAREAWPGQAREELDAARRRLKAER